LGWEIKTNKKAVIQKQLFVQLSADEEHLLDIIKNKNQLNIDDLCLHAQMPMSKVSALLLTLEMSGIVKSLPGKMYKLN